MDQFTIVVAAGTVFFVLGALIVFMWSQDREARWLGWLSLLYFFGAFAGLMISQRGKLANVITMGAGTTLLLLALGSLWVGARTFEGRRPILWPALVVSLGWLVLFLIPEFDAPQSLSLRVFVASAVSCVFMLLAASELWRGMADPLPSRVPAIVLFCTGGAFFAFRAIASGWLPFPLGGQPIDGTAVAIFNLVVGIHALGITVLMVSLTKERRETQQRLLAETDALTGLPNRRAFAAEADRLLRRQKQAHGPTALLVLDLDHFKSINDRFGHEAGDKVLIEFAAVLNNSLRRDDLRFRIGGEEFCCILPGATMRDAQLAAERICQTFQATSVDVLGGSVRGTVSIGVSSTDICGYVLEDLLSEADAATYEAKATGRNRAVLAITLPKPPVLSLVGKTGDLRSPRKG